MIHVLVTSVLLLSFRNFGLVAQLQSEVVKREVYSTQAILDEGSSHVKTTSNKFLIICELNNNRNLEGLLQIPCIAFLPSTETKRCPSRNAMQGLLGEHEGDKRPK
ncbi:hypothetical protein EV1_027041 [Malus domestica]